MWNFDIIVSFIPFFIFGQKVKKRKKYYVIFVYISQGKMGKTEKNRKKITQLKWPKYQKSKDEYIEWVKHKSTDGTTIFAYFGKGGIFQIDYWVKIRDKGEKRIRWSG